jgi:CheY-like chemotaxis protein/two-component sensor histidine kinase
MEPDVSFENQKSYVEFINQSSDHLLAVVNDIIEISNIEAGILNYKQDEVNLNDLLINLHKQFNTQATEKGIKLSLKTGLADHKAEIKTDRAKLLQALSSLLTNALKFTSHGQIDFGYRLKNELLEFFVSDTGIGISEDQHLKIFNRFYKVEHSFSMLYEGTGLGLPICKAYVELLGGKIWLTSEPGKGSTFNFTIHYEEVKKAIAHEHHNHKIKISDTDGMKTILIAEDDDNNFKLIKELLSGPKIKIIRAYNGLEAVEICNEGPQIDLVLMDIKMPLIDGHMATRQILEHSPGMKIIAQTAFAGDEKLAMEAGCAGFISKPFLKNQLIEMVKEYL